MNTKVTVHNLTNNSSESKTQKGYISLGMSKRISFFDLTNEREFSTNKELHKPNTDP